MKKSLVLLLGLLAAGVSINAHAVTTSPRDLTCDVGAGTRVVLKSNNGLWAVWKDSKFNVDLQIEQGNGVVEQLTVAWANEKAQLTRGNAQGVREYIFVSPEGKEYFVTLEFHAPFGVAEGIKMFRVLSTSLQFEHSQPSLNGKCNVVYHELVDL